MSGEKVQIEPPSFNGVVQSPDGSMQYYTATPIKNKYNPYLYQNVLPDIESNTNSNSNDNSNDNYREVECNGETILILSRDLERAIRLEQKASLVRFLCLVDFFMNFLVSLSTPYIGLSSVIASLIALSGYYSTYTYSRLGLVAYLVYQYMQCIGRATLLCLFIAAAVSSEFKEKINNNSVIIFDPTSGNIVIVSLMTLGQIYITGFVQHFYNLLPSGRIRPRIRISSFTH